jgi:hypothetical protein
MNRSSKTSEDTVLLCSVSLKPSTVLSTPVLYCDSEHISNRIEHSSKSYIVKVSNCFCNDKYNLNINCVQCISFRFSGQTTHAYKTVMYAEHKNSAELTILCVCKYF